MWGSLWTECIEVADQYADQYASYGKRDNVDPRTPYYTLWRLMTRKDIFKLDLMAPEPLIYMSRFPVAKDLGKNIPTNATAAEVIMLLEEEAQRWSKRAKALNVLLAYERDDRKRYAEEKIAEEEARRLENERTKQLLEEERKKRQQERAQLAPLLSQQPRQTVPPSGRASGASPPALALPLPLPLPVNPVPGGAPPPSGFPSEAPSGGGNPPSSAGQPGAHPWQQTPYPFSQASGGYVCFAIYDFLSQH